MNALIIRNSEAITLSISDEFEQAKANVLIESRDVTTVADEFTQSMAIDAVKRLRDLESAVEFSRKDVKAPVLDIGRRIDSKAATALAGVPEERNRISRLLTVYAVEQERKAVEAERARKAELDRLERDRREREESERKRQAEIAHIAQEEQAAKDAADSAFTAEEFATATASVAAASVKREEHESASAADRQAIINSEAERLKLQTTVAVSKPRGLMVKTVWKFEVTDIHQVYLHSPSLVRLEVNAREINNVISSGGREIAGLRIWSEEIAEVRR